MTNLHTLTELLEHQRATRQRYFEFLRVPSLSVGLYRLPAGGQDPQQPHTEDEVYQVLAGRARLRVGAEDHAVAPGAILYVAAGVPHAFHTITEDLDVLVFFAPAEGTASAER
ncbi:MAG: cupin domain-containing protein [Anaerolineales bacterium]|nr:cupin domain-containing protein [Anaerolineales bacterium]